MANTWKLSDQLLSDIKEYLQNKVSYARFKSGSTWTKIKIYQTSILTDGRVGIYLLFDHEAPDQISQIEFYDTAGKLFASGTENINKESFDEGVLFRFSIRVEQAFSPEASTRSLSSGIYDD